MVNTNITHLPRLVRCFIIFFFLHFQVDPFLCLVKDCKLKTSDTGSVHPKTVYGSKDDDSSALRCLSEIKITQEQTTECLVSVIINNLDNLTNVS